MLHGFPPITTGMRSISGFIALPLTRISAMTVYWPVGSLPSSSIAKRQIFLRKRDADERDPAAGVHHHVPALRGGVFTNRGIDEPALSG